MRTIISVLKMNFVECVSKLPSIRENIIDKKMNINIKHLYLITSLFITPFMSIAQGQITKDSKSYSPVLLPPEAFDKMIIQDITYAIFGESSPVSGIKLDISKPEATISGVFQSKNSPWILTGLEFKGGITDKSFNIFKGLNNFNTAFELKPSIHFIPKWNKAKYYTYLIPVVKAKNELIIKKTKSLQDSFCVVVSIYNKHFADFENLMDDTKNLPTISAPQKDLLIFFIKKVLKDETLSIDNTMTFDNILDKIPKVDSNAIESTYNDDIVEIYKKYLKLYENSDFVKLSKEIENASHAWTQKKYFWFTISPFGRTEKITEYHTKYNGLDSLYFKADYPLYYGINLIINRYKLWPNKFALYWKAGISLSQADNLASLSSFNYETSSPLFSYGNTITTKHKTGTAYNNDEVKSDFMSQISAEIYLLPLKYFFPGLYFSSSINSSRLYQLPNVVDRGADKILIPLEGGLVFNINSKEKDKSILSLSVYFRHEDLTDKSRVSKITGKEESREDFMKRNLSFGLKVGIPITLPQRGS